KNLDFHFTLREANDVHASLGFTAHGIDIAQRVGSGDLTKNVGVIDNGSEKTDGVDDGEVGPKTIHPRVVGGFRSDQHVDVVKLRQAVQNLHEIGGAELGSSTRGLDLLRQPVCLIFTELHRKLILILLVLHFNSKVVFWIIHEPMAKPPGIFVGAGLKTHTYHFTIATARCP